MPERSLRCSGQSVGHEERAVGGDPLAGLEAVENLPKSVLQQADLNRAAGEAVAIGRHPRRHRVVALADDPAFRDGRRFDGFTRADDEGGEHLRPQLVLRVVNFGADLDTMSIWADRSRDIGDFAFEYPLWKCRHLDLDVLSQAKLRNLGLGDARQHPHGRHVGDGIRCRRIAGLHVKPHGRIACRHPASHRTWDRHLRVDAVSGNDLVHLCVGLAKDACRVAGGVIVALGRLMVGDRLFHVLLRPLPLPRRAPGLASRLWLSVRAVPQLELECPRRCSDRGCRCRTELDPS